MPYDGSGIDLRLLTDHASGEVLATWTDARPAGTTYQVWVDGRLFGSTTARSMALTIGGGRHLVQVGAVAAGEEATPQQPPAPDPARLGTGLRPALAWRGTGGLAHGGRALAEFRVWRGAAQGEAADPDNAAPVASIPAGPLPGWCVGGWCAGGWCAGERSYRWVDPTALGPGDWSYAIAPGDGAGAIGPATLLDVTIVAPPRAVATLLPIRHDGRRVEIDATDPAAPVLRWGISPDWSPPPAPSATGTLATEFGGTASAHAVPPAIGTLATEFGGSAAFEVVPGANEVQRFAVFADPPTGGGGQVELGYGGDSVLIDEGWTAGQIQTALETIPALTGNVSVTGGPMDPDVNVFVEFVNALGGIDITDGLTVVALIGFSGYTLVEHVKGGT